LISSDGRLSAGINEEGIQFYNNLIDELIENGYNPFLFLDDCVS
jgi:beta-glucosidase